ncbi:immunoglobulin-like domain-containing protein [Traorella massiliensis]|uniref:immunoglobulin-like domain-containing protein n=1 Tax=Traorella massiliensis TaxID=1903263 RepID=UPI002354ECF9|nr:immunoglobulin-like domain-containing protein [Traorella massiliensis]
MKAIIKSHVVLKTALATVMALSCLNCGSTVLATENLMTDTVQNETSYAKITSIKQNEDNTVTITLDKKIKKSNMSGSSPGSKWVYDDELSLTSNVIPESGEFFVDVILLDVDGKTTHHNLYRNAEGEWSVVVEYRYNEEFLHINPQLFIQIGNELVEIEDYKQYGYLGNNYVVEETFTATPKIVVKGYDLEDIETYLQSHSDTKNIYEPTGDHTTTVGYLENEGKTVSGIYTVFIDHKVNGSQFMPKIEIKYKEADRTALDEKITEAQAISNNGYTEESYAALQTEIEKASAVSSSNISTQSEIDSALVDLQQAIDDLKVEIVKPQILSAVEEDGEIKLELSAKPEGLGTEIRPASGYGEYFSYLEEGDKVYAVSKNFPEGEVYTVLTFKLSEADEKGNLYADYWLYRDAEGNITYGEVPPINETPDPTVTITVGDKSYNLKKSGSGVTTIEVGPNDKATVTIEGVDLQKIRYTDPDYEYVDVSVDGNHQTKIFNLVDSTGTLTSGYYIFEVTNPSVSSTSLEDNVGKYHSYDLKVNVVTVDKTKLQALYNDVKDYESTDSYYKYFVEELEEAKKILDDPNATQDQVDMKVDQLSGSYYALLVSKLNSMYSPTIGSEDLMKYTTDSLIPVINMWGITHNRTNNNYEENSIIGNVGQMKGWYEEYIKAVEGLEEATLEDHYIGLYEEVTSTKKYQGHFEVVKEEVVEVNGEKKIRLTVQFINDGLHPVYGEELPNANGTTKFEDFSIDRDGDNIHAKVNTYNEEFKQQRYTNLANITPLDGNTNYYDGFQGTIDLNPTDKYVTFDFYASSNSYKTYSPWYYRVSERDLTAPNATVTTSNNGAPTNQSVTVTITADESIQEAEGWTLNEDGMTLTKVFDENTTGTITITDLAGNETEVSYTVSGIDKEAPEIIKIVPNSDGTVTVKFDEPVTIEADEWKESEAAYEQGGQFWVGTLTENKFYDVTAKDAVGNTVEFRVDHEKPEPIVSYSTTDPTNKDVTVTVTFPNEENFVYLTSSTENPGWTNISGTNQWQKVFSANAAETVRFHDSMGNETSVEIKVENIDTTGPELDVEYSTDQPTNASVTVTVKSDEPIDSTRLPEGWTLSEDGLTATKIYDENRNETVIFADKLGNTSEVQISVDNIDKTNPIIELTEKNVIICEGDEFDPLDLVVSVTDGQADLSQSLVIIEEPKIDTDKIGTYVITYQVEDAAGNVTKEIVTLTVNPKMAEINAIPVITANDQTIKVNDTFDVLANVSAADKEDGDLTNNIKVIANDVDTTKPGIYHVTYQVSDSTGGTSTKTITVTVADNTVPTDPEEPSTPDEPDTGEEKPGDTTETPSTSDQSMMSLYIGLLTVSAWMLAVLLRRKREAK